MGNKKASVKWASDDDAGDLLAGILSETEDEAELEQQRVEAEIKAREEEERKRKEAESAQKRADAEARISAEMDRLEQVEKRRTQKIQALKIEELKESGQWKPPQEEAPPEPVQQAPAPAPAPTPRAAAQPAGYVPEPQATPKSNTMPLAILGGLVVMALLAVVVIVALAGGGYEPDGTPYTKAVYSPKDSQTLLVEMAFAPIPKEEPKVEEPARPAVRRAAPRRAARPAAAASAPAKAQPKQAPKKKKIDLDLDFDPFSGGF